MPTSPRPRRHRAVRAALLLLVSAVVATAVAGCAASAPQAPPPGATFDYQLGAAYEPPAGTDVVVRDSTAEPAAGAYGVCYVNGFQTQPGVDWLDELLVHRASGELLVDPGWPDEHLFDLARPETRAAVAARMTATIEGCADDGYDAVEFDNLDSYSRSEGTFGLDDAVAYATLLVDRAHAAGLAAAQKNTAELESRGRDEVGFDFAVVEECDAYDECPAFTEVYGDRVLAVEYSDDLRDTFAGTCGRATTPASTVLRDRDLVGPDDPGYVSKRC
ncbi:hypothetical protein ABID92_002767 [Frigoribacterium sp. PvP120]|uniref:endo alpha-1,4 polygalactosaminidase n=1 Tax=unclassified Frigoribacterium TaxID=2627005 RepID=UPI001B47F22D|nr:endo alpha-1,4 polygalactosaminidase [Frigoribacterium sp. PvP121]MBP1240731.1 hypothetical protein [Frigoribacterium sp. PvP121]